MPSKPSQTIAVRAAVMLLICLLLAPPSVFAWSWPMISDPKAVKDSEFVVVAKILPESIKRVEHSSGSSHEHHATLEIVEFLKGHSEKKQMEIIIHYGLDPVVGECRGTKMKLDANYRLIVVGDAKVIGIWDMGGMCTPITEDVREPHIWLLTRNYRLYGTPDSNNRPGVWAPCHIQAITQKEKLQKIISQK